MLITPRTRLVGCIAFSLWCCLWLTGCSATKAIEADASLVKREAAAVKDKAAESKQSAKEIADYAEPLKQSGHLVEYAGIKTRATTIADNQDFIIERADVVAQAGQRIDDNADDVKDKGGWFSRVLSILWWAFLIGCGVAAVIVLEKLGLAPILRKIMSWIPWLIPTPTQKKAELAVKVIDPAQPEQPTHLVAAMRAADPVFNAAFERQKRLMEQQEAQRLLEQQQEVVTA